MTRFAPFFAAAALLAPAITPATAALASASVGFERAGPAPAVRELPPYLQCVPYARQLTGIQIFGDAHTWWDQAAGRYERGRTPRVGAVMAFVPHRNMNLGHVAAVSRVIDSRTVLLDHANWSPINGRRGQIERDVRAVDVSPGNDWSQVRVWYAPMGDLGKSSWPVHGFIYPKKARLDRGTIAAAAAPAGPVRAAPAPVPAARPQAATPSRAFASAFAGFEAAPAAVPARAQPRAVAMQAVPQRKALPQAKPLPQRRAATATGAAPVRTASRDPIEAALARYSR